MLATCGRILYRQEQNMQSIYFSLIKKTDSTKMVHLLRDVMHSMCNILYIARCDTLNIEEKNKNLSAMSPDYHTKAARTQRFLTAMLIRPSRVQ